MGNEIKASLMGAAVTLAVGAFGFSLTYGASLATIETNTNNLENIQTVLNGTDGTGGLIAAVTSLNSSAEAISKRLGELDTLMRGPDGRDGLLSSLTRIEERMGGLEDGYGQIDKLKAAILGEPGQPGMQGELSAVSASLRDFRSEWERDPRIRETLIALEKDVKQVLPLSVQAEFQKAVEALRAEIRALQDQVDDLEGRNDDLLSENKDYRSRLELLQSEAERTIALQDQLAEARARLDVLTAAIASEGDAAKEKMEALQTQVQDLRTYQDALRAAIENIAQDLDGIISDYEAAIVGVPEQDRLIYVKRFNEVLANLRGLVADN